MYQTGLAIVFGSAVMVTDPVFGDLAISPIIGKLASAMLTLIAIPLIYDGWRQSVS